MSAAEKQGARSQPGKRGWGGGTIEQRGPDKWVVRLSTVVTQQPESGYVTAGPYEAAAVMPSAF